MSAVGLEVLELLGTHLEAELLLDQDDDVHDLEAVDAEVLLQAGVLLDLRFVNLQLVDEKGVHLLIYFVDIHIVI